VLVNSFIGQQLLESINGELIIEERTWEDAHKSNKQLSEPNEMPEKYVQFWKDYFNGGFNQVMANYYLPDVKSEHKTRIIAWKRAHEYMLPKMLRK
jgi:hypothetical protein